MKALICAINSKYIHSSLAPWCLGAGLERYARQVEYEVAEGTINEEQSVILNRLKLDNYDVVGFCTYIWNVSYVMELCKAIKKDYNIKIVLGGPEVSHNAEEYLQNYDIDYIISGEGELPFARLCRGDAINEIEGLCYRNGDEFVIKAPYVSFDEPPSPYTKKYFDSLNGRIAYIEASRGCPFNCAFCLSGRCEGVRFFDLEETKKRITLLANSGAKTIKFIDRTFNANKRRARELFSFVIENYGGSLPKGTCFHFEIAGELIDRETIELLSKAPRGAIQLEIGIQSFNPKTLEHINRKTDIGLLVKNIRSLVALGNMHIHIDLIVGLPYENLESLENSFNLAYELNANMLQIGFLKILHGSELKMKSEEYQIEYSKKPPYEVISTPWLSKEEIEIIHTVEDIFEKMYNSGRFKRTCKYLACRTQSPFRLFLNFAKHLADKERVTSLDLLTYEIYSYFSQKPEIDENELRDLMVMDRLSTNRMGTIPEFLKIHSPLTKKLLNELENSPDTKRQKNTKRAISLLSDMKEFVYVDYIEPDSVTKEYVLYKKTI